MGEKALGPALAVAIGVSTRYVRKVLRESKGEETEKTTVVKLTEQPANLALEPVNNWSDVGESTNWQLAGPLQGI